MLVVQIGSQIDDKLAKQSATYCHQTPGRIYDLVKSGDLAIHKARFLLSMKPTWPWIWDSWRQSIRLQEASQKAQFMVFSATIHKNCNHSWKKYLSNPVMEKIRPKPLSLIPLITGWFRLGSLTRNAQALWINSSHASYSNDFINANACGWITCIPNSSRAWR